METVNYLKLYLVISLSIITANLVISIIDNYRKREIRKLEKEKLRLEIEYKKKTLNQ